MKRLTLFLFLFLVLVAALPADELKVRLTWQGAPKTVTLSPSAGVEVRDRTAAPGGLSFTLVYPRQDVQPIRNLQTIWAYLIAHSDADTVRRLTQDPAFRQDSRRLTVELDPGGARGFTLTVDQLLSNSSFRVPSMDLDITTGARAASGQQAGARILDRVHREPEATYEQYKERWEDMGSPAYSHPSQPAPGHIIGITWDSAIPKFGIDRGAGVWNDYGNPDRFRFWFSFANLPEGLAPYWKAQRLTEGLPVVVTTLERDGIRYEVEQFAYPLGGPPPQRTGSLDMVLLQRVRLTDLLGRSRTVPVTMVHERRFPPKSETEIAARRTNSVWTFEDAASQGTLLAVDPGAARLDWSTARDGPRDFRTLYVTLSVKLPARGSAEFGVKLPSPAVRAADLSALVRLDYAAARSRTLRFWSDLLARGAQFSVPEAAVNTLFRASLWHAFRLPRRHEPDAAGRVEIDLPYSNFAYDQLGTPWPVNQAVYVDYMLYGLRGYSAVAAEEIEAIYRKNQEPGGRVNGYAHWGVYTPGMLYAVAHNFLLSGDREALERVLPQSLKALDWCLEQMRKSGSGLVSAPLNDLTGEGLWAFNQAYFYAGIERFGKALERYGHARSAECLDAAASFRKAVEKAFRTASVRSPLVQLRDRSWTPYVPCEATHAGRLFGQWYPTDVDTGAVHLLRLGVLAPSGDLADALLNDHEDNLYLHGWGMANEPVYNQQGTAYLLRDDAKAVIRAFYSYMASAFSHSAFEPVEHRWRWGQYFGPPSTDGAWFELYRNMLVREMDDSTLLLAQAAPRRWLEDGREIVVSNAPTYFGKLSYTIESRAGSGVIDASIDIQSGNKPKAILLRLRHPESKLLRGVTINSRPSKDFDAQREWIRLSGGESHYTVTAQY